MERLPKRQAEKLLAFCLECGRVIAGKHFREELENEAVPLPAAREVLAKGRIYNEPEFHVRTQEWNYRIEGYEPVENGSQLYSALSRRVLCSL